MAYRVVQLSNGWLYRFRNGRYEATLPGETLAGHWEPIQRPEWNPQDIMLLAWLQAPDTIATPETTT